MDEEFLTKADINRAWSRKKKLDADENSTEEVTLPSLFLDSHLSLSLALVRSLNTPSPYQIMSEHSFNKCNTPLNAMNTISLLILPFT
jgi:hypothetical protein